MAPAPKTERFMIRMDPDERRMLTEMADQAGTSEATIVRQLVRRAYAEQSTTQPAKRAKPKR